LGDSTPPLQRKDTMALVLSNPAPVNNAALFAAVPIVFAAATLLGCFAKAKDLQERNEDLEQEVRMNQQHIHELEANIDLLEKTVEHLGGELPSAIPDALLDEVILGVLKKARGKTKHEVHALVVKVYPTVEKKLVNSRLYTLRKRRLAESKQKKGESAPLWFAV
jgi:hypothetical protein